MRIHNVNSNGRLALVCYDHKEYDYNRRYDHCEALPEERRTHLRIRRICVAIVLVVFAAVIVWQIRQSVNYCNQVMDFAESDYVELKRDLMRSSSVSSSEYDDVSFVVDGNKAYVTLNGAKVELADGELHERIVRFAKDYGCNNGNQWRFDIMRAIYGDAFVIVLIMVTIAVFFGWFLYSEGVPFEKRISLRALCRKKVFYLI